MCDTNHDKSDLGLLAAEVHKLVRRLDEIRAEGADEFTVNGRIPKTIIENLRNLSAKPDAENKAINEILEAIRAADRDDVWAQSPRVAVAFCKNIHKIDSPVDLYEHNEEFRKGLNKYSIYLRWGIKACLAYDHAYMLKFGEGPGEIYTIITNRDLDECDFSAFSWKNHDIMISSLDERD